MKIFFLSFVEFCSANFVLYYEKDFPMKKILTLLTLSSLLNCINPHKSSAMKDSMAILLATPTQFQISANLNNGTPMANAMVYFSKTTTTTSASVRATTANSNSTTGPIFDTSVQTDENGNLTFILAVGEYSVIATGLDNKSQTFKIKIDGPSGLSLTKEGTATITYSDGTVKVVIISVIPAPNAIMNAAVSFVCGYNPLGDTAAPELSSVELGSDTVDLSGGTGTVTIKANLVEGYEGTSEDKKSSGIKYAIAKLYSPNKIAGTGGYAGYATLTLNSASGLYEGDITLTNFVENGTWKVGLIHTRDNAGNERDYILDATVSTTNLLFTGCGQKIDSKIIAPSITVTGSSPDTEAPVIGTPVLKSVITGGATQDPIAANIDISTSSSNPQEVSITVTVTATDGGGTGNASGVAYMDARLQSYSWWDTTSNYLGNTVYIRLDLTSGTKTNGTYSGTATIRSYAEGSIAGDGLWKLGGIWITDNAGNSLWTDRDTLNKSFTIINAATTATADFYAPELKSISLDKTEVGFDKTFTITADVADIATETTAADQNVATTSTTTTNQNNTTPSGVKTVNAVIYSPLKLLDNTMGQTKYVSLTLNATTNKYEGSSTFLSTDNQEGGTWKLGWIEVSDNAGNYRLYKLTEGYNYYTYIKLTKTSGDITNSFNVTNIEPASITRN